MLQSEQLENNFTINVTYTRQDSEIAYNMFFAVCNEAKWNIFSYTTKLTN